MFIDEEVQKTSVKEPALQITPKEDLSIKYYELDLPSRGKLGYPATIEYRDILVRDEKILSTATGDSSLILNKILKSLIKDCDDWFDKVSLLDRDFMLMWIWANSYSTKKILNIQCKHCGHVEERTVDLTSVEVKDISEKYKSPFEYKLSNGDVLELRLSTVGDEAIAKKYIASHPNNNFIFVMFALTMNVQGQHLLLDQKIDYLENKIKGKEMGMIRAFHTYFKYGLDEEIPHTCSACGEVTPFGLPFRLDDLLPTLSDDFEALL